MVSLSETDDSESEVEWQVVTARKRNRSPSNLIEPPNKNLKHDVQTNTRNMNAVQTTAVPTNAVPTDQPSTSNSNRYSALDTEQNKADENANSNVDASNATAELKPPPIFIPFVENVANMIADFVKVIPAAQFSYKALRGNQVKVSIQSVNDYKKIVEYCLKKNVKFHTYQLKTERAFRVVIKNLHHTTPINEIKEAIELDGHKVRNVLNVRSRVTKVPLSLFFLDLEPAQNNKEIYNITKLNRAIVKIEPPRQVKELVQCHRCQQFGHTKSYCMKPFRCVKCGEDHPTAECRKPRNTPAHCSNCEKDHPANYRGCIVYQKIMKDKYHQNVPNQFITPYPTNNPQNYHNNAIQNNIGDNNNLDYAQVLKGTVQTNQLQKLEQLITKQIELTNNLLNMITLLVNKLCK